MIERILRHMANKRWQRAVRPRGPALGLEPLEDRALPAVLVDIDGTGRLSLLPDAADTDNTITVDRLSPLTVAISATEALTAGTAPAAVGQLTSSGG